MSTAFITHSDCLNHDPGPYHPENQNRLSALMDVLQDASRLGRLVSDGQVEVHTPQKAEVELLSTVHSGAYVTSVQEWCESGLDVLPTGDTNICPESYNAALLAAGSVIAGVALVMVGKIDNAFCGVRPPGHHAESDRGMGFCIFNNVALGAKRAQLHYGAERVFIIDWDVHHGNGTQEIFENDPTVFYVSIHQYPLYPFTGMTWETGSGAGQGYTLNMPVNAGVGNAEYLHAFKERIVPAAQQFRPDLIMISAGFDAHRDDPLGGTEVTAEGFAEMTQLVAELAHSCCDGRIVSVLEGGYDLESLSTCVEHHVRVLSRA